MCGVLGRSGPCPTLIEIGSVARFDMIHAVVGGRLGARLLIAFRAAALQHREDHRLAEAVALQPDNLFGLDREDRLVAVDQREDHRLGDARLRQRDNLVDGDRRRLARHGQPEGQTAENDRGRIRRA